MKYRVRIPVIGVAVMEVDAASAEAAKAAAFSHVRASMTFGIAGAEADFQYLDVAEGPAAGIAAVEAELAASGDWQTSTLAWVAEEMEP